MNANPLHRRPAAPPRRWLLAAALLLTACGGKRVITGQVTDHRGEPVDRVIVSLEPGRVELVTDREGRFLIDYLRDEAAERTRLAPRTTYRLELFKPGYHPLSRDVPYRSGPLDLGLLGLIPDVLRVQDDGQNLVPTLGEDRSTSGGATYEGQ